MHAKDSIDRVLSIPNTWLVDIAEDGRTALFVTDRPGSLQLYAVPARGGPSRALSHGKDRVVFAQIAHNGRDVVFSRDFQGKEDYQLFRVPLRGGREKQLTHLPPTRLFDFAWSHGDRHIAMAGANREFNGLWLLDPTDGTGKDVFRAPGWVFGPDWSPGDRELVFSAKTTDAPTAMELVFQDPFGGEPTVYTPKAGSENSGANWHPEEPQVLFKTDARGRYELAVYDRKQRELNYLRAGGLGLDFNGFDWMPDGDDVYYVASKEGRSRLYVERADGSGRPREIPLPKGNHSAKVGPDGSFFLFSWSSLAAPSALSRIERKSGRIRTLEGSRPGLRLGTARPVEYPSFDGLRIQGWFLTPPNGRGRLPCVLWVHGGPAWQVADEWNPAIQSLLVSGYAVFAPNIRGSTGYGADFERMNIRDLGGDDLRDVAEAAKYLRRRSDVDPDRIAIVGASYGGFMTFLAMTKLPDLWTAGAAIVGITDWRAMYEASDAAFRSFIERYFGTPEENPKLYRDRSPIHFVQRLKAPLLIWHRGNDSRCPVKPVKVFAEGAKALGKDVEMTVVWDEGHGWQKTRNLIRQYRGVIDFLNRRLAA